MNLPLTTTSDYKRQDDISSGEGSRSEVDWGGG